MAKLISKFDVGDYVEYTGKENPMGMFGIIALVRDSGYLVEFYDFDNGHCGTGSGYQAKRYNACWNCDGKDLKLAYIDFSVDL